ncbi:Pepco domain-containing protein [Leekyejoonella antrihumi]|uniref:Pepco domain-containing protein n=1 Tax=Leekyejoonella antrihumi TaxID=1660198 RepID=A0A563E1P5_9MICO|nr:hypothetical protein [Leekyejoonella antrihumi]TWP36102.1 hypothetical protein FGL98_11685 [Leekyejoonella antrihumi]
MTTQASQPDIEVWVAAPPMLQAEDNPGEGYGQSDSFGNADEVELQSKVLDLWKRRAARVDPAEFLDSWKKAFQAVEAIFTADSEPNQKSKYVLDSVTAKLSLTASGKVAFVAELSGEVAFEATFKRRQ